MFFGAAPAGSLGLGWLDALLLGGARTPPGAGAGDDVVNGVL